MIIKQRFEPIALKIWKYLNVRATLSAAEIKKFSTCAKGYDGEKEFDKWGENLSSECLFLNDLLLEYDQNIFQIDTLLITHETIYLINVKNYDGDFYYESGKWYTLARSEIKDPLLQLKRSEYLFKKLIQSIDSTNFIIEHLLVFINPRFHLYHAPTNLPIIYPAQLDRFKTKLNMQTAKLNDRHLKIAKQLLSLHKTNSFYTQIPDYDYDQLKKGVVCLTCRSFKLDLNKDKVVCLECGCVEAVELAVLRSVGEFKLLFPDKKITTHIIHEWCAMFKSKKTIRRILSKNFKLFGHGKSSHYDDK